MNRMHFMRGRDTFQVNIKRKWQRTSVFLNPLTHNNLTGVECLLPRVCKDGMR
jgi:hypothetical protein